MPDIYLDVAAIPPARLADMMASLERRAATPQQAAALEAYLGGIAFPDAAEVLDIGCGTGPQARRLARWPGVARVRAFDQIPAFVEYARELAAGIDNLSFEIADAAAVPVADESADVAVLHTVLSHVASAADVLAEARRVLRPGGTLAVYDGDFTTMSVAQGDGDPLQACIDGFVEFNVNDKWLIRRLPAMMRAAGFGPAEARSHGHLETAAPVLTLGWTLRGADYLAEAGRIDAAMADALKAEAHRRVEAERFYGYMNYVSLIARKAT